MAVYQVVGKTCHSKPQMSHDGAMGKTIIIYPLRSMDIWKTKPLAHLMLFNSFCYIWNRTSTSDPKLTATNTRLPLTMSQGYKKDQWSSPQGATCSQIPTWSLGPAVVEHLVWLGPGCSGGRGSARDPSQVKTAPTGPLLFHPVKFSHGYLHLNMLM